MTPAVAQDVDEVLETTLDSNSDSNVESTAKTMAATTLQDPASSTPVVSSPEPLTQDMVFRNMRLRRILRENHGKSLNQIVFFMNVKHRQHAPVGLEFQKTFDKQGAVERDEDDTSNLLATVGDCQASVYDNEHCGDHLDIMCNYRLGSESEGNETTTSIENSGGASLEFTTCCWIHREEDAWLAVAGSDAHIHILSLAYSKELGRLGGHTEAITDLQAHPLNDYHILSASKDGTVRLWDLRIHRCVCVFQVHTNVTSFHPSGRTFYTGTSRGKLEEWTIPCELLDSAASLDPDSSELPFQVAQGKSILTYHHGLSDVIVCIRQAQGNLVFSNASGMLVLCDYQGNILQQMRVKNNGTNRCRFDISLDEQYLCVGNGQGVVYVFQLTLGKIIAELKHKRSTKAIKTCVFTRDCRSILYGSDDAFLWRFDYIDDDTLREWATRHSVTD
ncbi:hypothetical protein IWQ62_004042 [Dispira parvispora]|uniref:Uncharacterized protein n=1 Tax=Dispira parvispora TaxID=1520584 RepID=A0A9W8ALP6_9FUNG|nr:hypothetical protein IWQ62_004042 [Dispira parvispora]